MRNILLLLLLVAFSGTVWAQGEYSAAVLLVNPDSRVVSMGGAGVALADDISAVYLNPAGLGFQSNGEVALHYSRLLPGLYDGLHFVSATYKNKFRDYGTFGVAVYHMQQGEGDIMDASGTVLGDYTSSESVLLFSAGHRCAKYPDLAFGTNLKFIYSNLADGTFDNSVSGNGKAFALAFDLGALWRRPLEKFAPWGWSLAPMDFGLTLANFGTRMDYSDGHHRDPLPLALRLGTVYHQQVNSDHRLNYLLDVERIMTYIQTENDGDPALLGFFRSFANDGFFQRFNLHLGTEYVFRNMVYGRLGVNVNPIGENNALNVGFGIRYQFAKLDFAYEIAELNNSLRFTISYLQ
jgi:hypothetical protein